MLISPTAENWKSIKKATLNIDPLTVVIGNNASGKSNILDAFDFLSRVSKGTQLTSALQGDSSQPQVRGGLEWAARRPGSTFALSATITSDPSTDFLYRIECRTNNRQCELVSEQLLRQKYRLKKGGERSPKPSQISIFRTDPVDRDAPTVTARLYNEKQGTPRQLSRASAILSQLIGQKSRAEIDEGLRITQAALQGIFILDPIPSHMRSFSPLSDTLAGDAGNIAGVLAAMSTSLKTDIEDTLTRYLAKLPERDIVRVYAEPVGKFGTDAMLYCEEKFGKGITTLDARGMSDGTLRFLGILTALLTRPQKSLLIVEEVDNGLHPSRSNLLLEMLREVGNGREVDVVVTTHNPALLDAMGTEMVPFITVANRDPKSGETRLTLLEDIRELPRLLANGTVGRISSRGLIERALQQQASGN